MPEKTKRMPFYSGRRGRVRKLHIETDGAVVNITVGLTDDAGHLITRVDVQPDDASRGGDGRGRVWFQPAGDARIMRLHDWERAPGVPRGCTCGTVLGVEISDGTARYTDESPRELTTCGACGRSWCERCTPTPSARCLFEYDHA